MSVKKKVAGALSRISPVLATKVKFYFNYRRPLDLSAPRTLDEKIQWLKLNTYRNNPLVTQCADKLLVRDYVESCGCGEILNTLYSVWETPEGIDWDHLPDRFAMKCNHGCGYNLLCTDRQKLDLADAKRKIAQWYAEDYWTISAEIQYRDIPKRITCERFIGSGEELYDYKIYCFNGKAQYVMVCVGRELGWPKFYFFDRNWNFCRITRDGKNAPEDFTLEKPRNFDAMIRYADILCAPFPFVRVDLYDAEGRVYFGELTFTPASGFDTNRLPETDILFGSLLTLPEHLRR